MRARLGTLVALLLAGAAPALAQKPTARDTTGFLYILQPAAWTGEGTRDVAARAMMVPKPDRLATVVGRVFHPNGITQVTVNKQQAALEPDQNRAMRFTATVNTDSIGEVEVAAYHPGGDPIVRRFAWRAPLVRAAQQPAKDSAAPETGARPPADSAAAAQAQPAVQEGPQNYIEIDSPGEWTGGGTRSAIMQPRQSIHVVGRAMTPTGVTKVLLNGKRAALQIDGAGTARFSGFITPEPSLRQVEITVAGQPGTPRLIKTYAVAPSEPGAPAAAATPGFKGERWAIVVGLSAYQDTAIRPLRYADADAKAFYDFLRSPESGLGGFKEDHVRLLLNDSATYQQIRSALFTFLKSATEDDQVYIYFAGHGVQDPQRQSDNYLLTYDTRAADISGTAFPMRDLSSAVNKLSARDVVVLTDACHSGGVALGLSDSRDALSVNQINQAFLDQLNASTGAIVVFTASRTNETSKEGEDWGGGHGVFTYYLLEALRGAADQDGDHIVTLDEMTEYVRDKVRRATANAQTPSVSTTPYDGMLPVSMVTEAGRVATTPEAAAQNAQPAAQAAAATAGVDRGKDNPMLTKLAEAVARDSTNALYRRNLAFALSQARLLQDAAREYQAALRFGSDNALYHNEYGLLLRQMGLPTEAAAELRRALDIDASTVKFAADYASALLATDRSAEAVEQFRKVLRLESNVAAYHHAYAVGLEKIGKRPEAAAEYQRAVQLQPDSAVYHRDYARALLGNGRLPDALADYREATRLAPANAAYHVELAELLAATGKPQEAAVELKTAVQLEPKNAALHARLASLFGQSGQVLEAVQHYQEAIRIEPRSAEYHFKLGEASARAGLEQDAMSEYQKAASLAPDDAATRHAYGLALLKANRVPEAAAELKETVRLAPQTPAYHYDLGQVLATQGFLTEAVAQLEAAVAQEPSNRGYKDLLKKVKQQQKKQK